MTLFIHTSSRLLAFVILAFVFLFTACNLPGNVSTIAHLDTPVPTVRVAEKAPVPSPTTPVKEKNPVPSLTSTLVPPTATPEEAEEDNGEIDVTPDETNASAFSFLRSSVPYSVILCKFKDTGNPSKTVDYFRDMFITKGTHGLNDYWSEVSYGNINLDGTVVKGWYTEQFTAAEAMDRANQKQTQPYHDCIDTAKNAPTDSYIPPKDNLVVVITDPGIHSWGIGGVGAFFVSTIDLTGAAHELGHSLGLSHSYSDSSTYRNKSTSAIGEYDDPWDLMSAENVFHFSLEKFRRGGPGLNVYKLDYLGWLPNSRVLTFGADGATTKTVTLAALNHPEAAGSLEIRIPFDPRDPFHYYTVEFRRKDGWDAGIPGDTVLIHEVKPNPTKSNANAYDSFLLRANNESGRPPVQSLNANGVSITISSMSPQTNQAAVTITTKFSASEGNFAKKTDGPNACKPDYFWRMADDNDYVCVTAAVRDQTRNDNAQAASRRSPNGDCVKGYVPRKAFSTDSVCVTPAVQSQVQKDNAEAGTRLVQPHVLY